MKRKLAAFGAAMLAIVASIALYMQPASAAVGLHVSGRTIVEANGTFVMRGPAMRTPGPHQTTSFADIKSLGANTVRVVLSGGPWAANAGTDVANVVARCKQNKLICVLEDHDTTGYGEDSAAYTLDQAVNYWISVKSAIVGQEDYVVINIGNEPFGNNNPCRGPRPPRPRSGCAATVSSTRSWSTRPTGARTGASSCATTRRRLGRRRQHNTVFSIHMYGVFDTAARSPAT